MKQVAVLSRWLRVYGPERVSNTTMSKNPQERLPSVELIRSGRLMTILGEETPLSQFLREELDTTKKTVDQLQAKLSDSDLKNAQLKEENEKCLMERATNVTVINSLHDRIEQIQREKEQVQREKERLEVEKEQLQQKNEQLQNELANASHLLNNAFFRAIRMYSKDFVPNYPQFHAYLEMQVHGVATIVPGSFDVDEPADPFFTAEFSLTDTTLIKFAYITCSQEQKSAMEHHDTSFHFTAILTGSDPVSGYPYLTLINFSPCSATSAGEEYERFLSECGISVHNLPRPTTGSTVETASGIVFGTTHRPEAYFLSVNGFDMSLTFSEKERPLLAELAESCRRFPQPRELKVSISNSDGSRMIVRLLDTPTSIGPHLHQPQKLRAETNERHKFLTDLFSRVYVPIPKVPTIIVELRIVASDVIVMFSQWHYRVSGSTITRINSSSWAGSFTTPVSKGVHRLSIKTEAEYVKLGVLDAVEYPKYLTKAVQQSPKAVMMSNADGSLWSAGNYVGQNALPQPGQELSVEADLEKGTLHFFVDDVQQQHHFINIPVPLVFALDACRNDVPIEITFWPVKLCPVEVSMSSPMSSLLFKLHGNWMISSPSF
ncbi:hypothetical protein BLNAU_16499 [Blattamonas nauphoetae]|uniref:SPRY domain-containing protein n=1 Tax=Blattamonas nauphoetae TaxID=2049346 RepID=A0ABQ9XBI8_9EUKA|nr:hypothetical protein BLNAU_16499 [Blattamonas nauphoetae]